MEGVNDQDASDSDNSHAVAVAPAHVDTLSRNTPIGDAHSSISTANTDGEIRMLLKQDATRRESAPARRETDLEARLPAPVANGEEIGSAEEPHGKLTKSPATCADKHDVAKRSLTTIAKSQSMMEASQTAVHTAVPIATSANASPVLIKTSRPTRPPTEAQHDDAAAGIAAGMSRMRLRTEQENEDDLERSLCWE
ncbi:hypothetical protein LTR08_002443 [Meristemomyces frigidus]|nr:hypothetical protein LTR08_002443 [Meristemomyces frigidus]